jgi:hypothetical protein
MSSQSNSTRLGTLLFENHLYLPVEIYPRSSRRTEWPVSNRVLRQVSFSERTSTISEVIFNAHDAMTKTFGCDPERP